MIGVIRVIDSVRDRRQPLVGQMSLVIAGTGSRAV